MMLKATLFLCLARYVLGSSWNLFTGSSGSGASTISSSNTPWGASSNSASKSDTTGGFLTGTFNGGGGHWISEIYDENTPTSSSANTQETRTSGTLRSGSSSDRYPYYARVLVGRSITCSGVLVHPEVILTAAQCWRENSEVTVKIGQETVDVEEVRPHSDWNNNFPFDIMTVHLKIPIEGVIPIQKMNENSLSLRSEDELIVLNSDDSDEFPVDEIFFEDCNEEYAYQLDENKHVCATTNTCVAFEGGGPLIIKGADSTTDVLVGMASFHQKDSCGGSLGFTRVSEYSFWILEQTCAVSWAFIPEDCPKPSAAPSLSSFPTSAPSATPSLSMEPTAPTFEPTDMPSLPFLDCSEFSGCDPKDPEKVSICTVHDDTKMTTQACSRKTEVWFHGYGDHYCGPCQSTCYEMEEHHNPRDPCDDAMYCKFQIETERDYSQFNKNSNRNGSMQRCTWLHSQTEAVRANYCAVGQEARTLCPETCGVCTDGCEDDASAKVMVRGSQRSCAYLQIRPYLQEEVCVQGSDVWNTCREFCGNCVEMDDKTYWEIRNATSISRAGEIITPAPTSTPSISLAPTSTPAPSTTRPTSSPPTRSCTECSDIGNVWMQSQGEECALDHYFIPRKCNKNQAWIKHKYCRHTCSLAGFGYEGDDCCDTIL
mmetsp:Transcript_16189/g.24443  ORF Transcript_16189/g.24443 Transcript_16189/m.24443 type:complete len:655 (-) Transcript_16189:309-2273(-)